MRESFHAATEDCLTTRNQRDAALAQWAADTARLEQAVSELQTSSTARKQQHQAEREAWEADTAAAAEAAACREAGLLAQMADEKSSLEQSAAQALEECQAAAAEREAGLQAQMEVRGTRAVPHWVALACGGCVVCRRRARIFFCASFVLFCCVSFSFPSGWSWRAHLCFRASSHFFVHRSTLRPTRSAMRRTRRKWPSWQASWLLGRSSTRSLMPNTVSRSRTGRSGLPQRRRTLRQRSKSAPMSLLGSSRLKTRFVARSSGRVGRVGCVRCVGCVGCWVGWVGWVLGVLGGLRCSRSAFSLLFAFSFLVLQAQQDAQAAQVALQASEQETAEVQAAFAAHQDRVRRSRVGLLCVPTVTFGAMARIVTPFFSLCPPPPPPPQPYSPCDVSLAVCQHNKLVRAGKAELKRLTEERDRFEKEARAFAQQSKVKGEVCTAMSEKVRLLYAGASISALCSPVGHLRPQHFLFLPCVLCCCSCVLTHVAGEGPS